MSPMFYCPNCAVELLTASDVCPGCGAMFGPGSAWRPTATRPNIPASSVHSEPVAELGNAIPAISVFAIACPGLMAVPSLVNPFAFLVVLIAGIPIGFATGIIFSVIAWSWASISGTQVRAGTGTLLGLFSGFAVFAAIALYSGQSRQIPDGAFIYLLAGGFSGYLSGRKFPIGK